MRSDHRLADHWLVYGVVGGVVGAYARHLDSGEVGVDTLLAAGVRAFVCFCVGAWLASQLVSRQSRWSVPLAVWSGSILFSLVAFGVPTIGYALDHRASIDASWVVDELFMLLVTRPALFASVGAVFVIVLLFIERAVREATAWPTHPDV